jgi:hypothetical protein
MLSNDDRTKIRQDIVVAILGIAVGALTTFVTKFIEAEYAYQRNLKVVEYEGKCASDKLDDSGNHSVECALSIQGRGLKAIKGVELAVTSTPESGAAVKSRGLTTEPDFAPPDPQPQIEGNNLDSGFQAVLLERIKEPQRITWHVAVIAKNPINPETQVQRTVTVRDDDARIEQGGTWRWKRWIPLVALAAAIPLVISFLLLVVLLTFRERGEQGSADDLLNV